MTILGDLNLYRINGELVKAQIVRKDVGNPRLEHVLTEFTVINLSNNALLGSLKWGLSNTDWPNMVQSLENHTHHLGVEKINGIGKLLIECAVAENFQSHSGTDFKPLLVATYSSLKQENPHWFYMGVGFLPRATHNFYLERFPHGIKIYQKLEDKLPLNEAEEKVFNEEEATLQKELNKKVTPREVCLKNSDLTLQEVFQKASQEQQRAPNSVMSGQFIMAEESFKKHWLSILLQSPLKHPKINAIREYALGKLKVEPEIEPKVESLTEKAKAIQADKTPQVDQSGAGIDQYTVFQKAAAVEKKVEKKSSS